MAGIVIVGAGQAAASMAAKLRNLGFDGPVTIFGAEPLAPYQRPPLSKGYLLGEMGTDRLMLRGQDWWAAQQIDMKTGQRVLAIDRTARELLLGDGTRFGYGQLALCTGASPRRLPASIGGELGGVYTVRSLTDVNAMRSEFQAGRKLVVVGGGYIGLEAAAVARKLGLAVTLVEAAPRILGRVACAETASAIRAMHAAHGVEIIEGVGIRRLSGNGRVAAVELADGRSLPADFVIVGIGVAPETGLAEAADLACEGGIAVDDHCRTSDPAIWAAGDCASFVLSGERVRIESVGNAIDMGEIVAENMLGADRRYVPKPWFWSDQFSSKLQIAGWNAGYTRVVAHRGDGQSFWYFRNEDLVAVDAIDDARAYMVGKRLIEGGRTVTPAQIAGATDLKALL